MLRKKLFFFFYRDRNVRASLQDTVSSAFVTRLDSLGDSSGCNEALGNDELGSVHAVVVFSVGYGGFQELCDRLACGFSCIGKNTGGGCYVLVADEIQNDRNLARRYSQIV